MSKNSTLLTIGAGLLLSLSFVDGGHAFQIDMNQTANLPIKQVSNTPTPCGGRSGVACRTQRPLGSGAMATAGSRYTRQVSTMPNPCGGRTGSLCRKDSPHGSREMAIAGSRYIKFNAHVVAEAGMLFGAGFIALVGLGARRLRVHGLTGITRRRQGSAENWEVLSFEFWVLSWPEERR